VADRAGSGIAQATGRAGERGSRFCRAQQKSARLLRAPYARQNRGYRSSSTRRGPLRYDGKTEERKRGGRGAPDSAAKTRPDCSGRAMTLLVIRTVVWNGKV
jgi:hypothetical protein